ncbi:hypothetical protein TWF718_008254 [Orbilia javanica]|uniref:Uncharacterized protein n=1 Tax=Orbilia javanica TaxID=47235 RepID=A0AAN8MXJ8_9PEZI
MCAVGIMTWKIKKKRKKKKNEKGKVIEITIKIRKSRKINAQYAVSKMILMDAGKSEVLQMISGEKKEMPSYRFWRWRGESKKQKKERTKVWFISKKREDSKAPAEMSKKQIAPPKIEM